MSETSYPDPTPMPSWRVTTPQVPTTGIGPGGVAGPGVNVPVQLSTGEVLSVFVPKTVYDQGADAVKAMIAEVVAKHQAIANLTSET